MNERDQLQPESTVDEPRAESPLFAGVFLGGFESSCHKLESGIRLDLLASTRHDVFADADYARLSSVGITACRDGVSWVSSERARGEYDFSRFASMLAAAEKHDIDVIWELMHFGWPDDVDPFAASFVDRFARYVAAFARFYASVTDRAPFITPINEMSFLAWAGGDVRCMNPFEAARGVELKVAFVRATIAAIDEIRAVIPNARFVQPEPLINIHPPADNPKIWARVESDNLLQYQAWDMLTGRVWPALGGAPKYLDIVGVNFYSNNQFTPDGETIYRDDIRYKPFAKMLLETYARYRRPMFLAETGAEGDARAPWLRYVVDQCIAAMRKGCELHGVTLYPIVNHPGWLDERHCENGLWDYADGAGHRAIDTRYAAELGRQTPRLERARSAMLAAKSKKGQASETDNWPLDAAAEAE